MAYTPSDITTEVKMKNCRFHMYLNSRERRERERERRDAERQEEAVYNRVSLNLDVCLWSKLRSERS
jgi:hypothetical protein